MNDDSAKAQLPSPNPSSISYQSAGSPIEPNNVSTPPNTTSVLSSDRRSSQLLNADGLHKYSCVVCATRKIKCDRKDPCGNCAKASSQCIYRAPPPPRRRKKGVAAQSSVLERLKRAEDMLANQQAGPSTINNMMWRLADMQLEKNGHLINHNNSTRYLDNSMWIWLNEELRDIRSALEDEASDEEAAGGPYTGSSPGIGEDPASSILFANSPRTVSLQDYHPTPVHIFQLWQLYLQNVHPLIKVLHSTTAQQQIIDAASHLDNVPRPIECLMFAMYFLVTVSLTEDECEERFQESKATMMSRYRQAAQIALLRADFLTSYSVTVLQAFLIYLVGLRPYGAPAAMWALSGIAVRMGHRMGLHRDGASLGLPVFDVEIRRRIWWEVIFFDSRTAQLSGTGGISLSKGVEYKQPANVNDSELYPGMKSPPVEHEGVTEMIHAMLRAEIGNFLIGFPHSKGTFDGSWQGVTQSAVPLPEKDRLIDELELRLERKFISKCDPLIPQHLLASTIARGALCNIRFMAHNPRQAARGGVVDPQEEQLLLDCACRILEHTIYIQTEPRLKRFAFYTRMHFQYLAMVYLLKMLRTYTKDVQSERGWQVVCGIYEMEPPILREAPKALYKAICDLTLSAWNSREIANPGLPRPIFIEELRRARGMTSEITIPQAANPFHTAASQAQLGSQIGTAPNVTAAVQPSIHPNQSAPITAPRSSSQYPPTVQTEAMDWDDWDDILQMGNLDAVDLASVEQEFLSVVQPTGAGGPMDFSAWGHPGTFN